MDLTEADIDAILDGMTPDQIRLFHAALKSRKAVTVAVPAGTRPRPVNVDRNNVRTALRGGQVTMDFIGKMVRLSKGNAEWTGTAAKVLEFIGTELIK